MMPFKCLLPLAVASSFALVAAEEPATKDAAKRTSAPARSHSVPFKLLSPEELNQLLARRVNPGMSGTFQQFANDFFASSRTATGVAVGLSTTSNDIRNVELQSPFPDFYKPRLSEFLDAIALQTFSEWSYDRDAQFGPAPNSIMRQMEGIASIVFTPVKNREKRFHLTVAPGWKAQDRGNWVQIIPQTAPAGMDIYELGSYSSDNPADKPALMAKVRQEIALQWARRVNPKATEADLKTVKVEAFDSLYYQTTTTSTDGKDMRWRHWVVTTKDQCFLILSTVYPEDEKELLPQVGAMLESIRFVDS